MTPAILETNICVQMYMHVTHIYMINVGLKYQYSKCIIKSERLNYFDFVPYKLRLIYMYKFVNLIHT